MKIIVSNLGKKFKNDFVLKDVSYMFETGKIYGLSGRNGTGKTVFLKMLCGLLKPSEGTITIDGIDLNVDNAYMFNIGALIENPKFFPDLNGYYNLKLLADIRGKIGDKEIEDALKNVNLYGEANKKFGNYSLGMKQKLGIAQAFMENQKIILLDEPFSGVEEISVNKIKDYLKKEVKRDKIIVISSHIKEDLIDLADEVIYFKNGTIESNKN